MKFLDLDWPSFFEKLEAWGQLPEEARLAYLEVKPSGDQPLKLVDEDDRRRLVAHGWIETKQQTLSVCPECRDFNKALRAMDRAQVLDHHVLDDHSLDDSGEADEPWALLTEYIKEHFTVEERQTLVAESLPRAVNRLDRLVASPAWLQDFLGYEQGARAPEHPQSKGIGAGPGGHRPDRVSLARRRRWEVLSPPILEVARWLVLELLAQRRPWSLEDALAAFELRSPGGDTPDRARFGDALGFLFREILVLVCIDDAARPFLGLWPAAAAGVERAQAVEAASINADPAGEIFERPVLVEDMLALLVESTIEPPRLKANRFELFAKSQKALAARLTPLPSWFGQQDSGWSPRARSDAACRRARVLGLVTTAGAPGVDLRLIPTSDGTRWAALAPADRLRRVIDSLGDGSGRSGTGSKSDLEEAWEDPEELWDDPERTDHPEIFAKPHAGLAGQLSYVPQQARVGYGYWYLRADLRPALIECFRTAPSDDFVRLAPFLHRQAGERNPYLGQVRARYSWVSEKDLDQAWLQALLVFFFRRLVALGGVALGHADRDYLFRVNPVGRYLLEETRELEIEATKQVADVIVQPNLEIVFLAPSTAAGLRLAAFASPTQAQRKGEQVGTLYRLTKSSVQRAAAAGFDLERLLAELSDLSSKPLPDNVVAQVRGWLESVRWAEARPALLIDAGNAETATRVLGAAGKKARLVSETVVELPATETVPPALRRKLIEAGVFVRETALND